MTQSFLALLPVFIIILIGFGLRWNKVVNTHYWPALDHICYFVLFPAIIFKEIAAGHVNHVRSLDPVSASNH